jgi:putative endonuclease
VFYGLFFLRFQKLSPPPRKNHRPACQRRTPLQYPSGKASGQAFVNPLYSRAANITFSHMPFFYVYILTDVATNTRHYTGYTTNLQQRLQKHNEGGVPSTAPYKPWRIKIAIAFTDEQKARDFESYLKSHSGRAFAAKHF